MTKVSTGLLLLIVAAGLVVLPVYAKSDKKQSAGDDTQVSENNGSQQKSETGEKDSTPGESGKPDTAGKPEKDSQAKIPQGAKIIGVGGKILKTTDVKADDLVIVSSKSGSGSAAKVYTRHATTSAELSRKAIQGVITAINGQVLTLAHQIQRDRTVSVDFSGAVIKNKTGTSDLQVGQRVVITGNPNGETFVALWIHVIPGKATGIFRRLPVATESGESPGTPSGTPPPSTESGTSTNSATLF